MLHRKLSYLWFLQSNDFDHKNKETIQIVGTCFYFLSFFCNVYLFLIDSKRPCFAFYKNNVKSFTIKSQQNT